MLNINDLKEKYTTLKDNVYKQIPNLAGFRSIDFVWKMAIFVHIVQLVEKWL